MKTTLAMLVPLASRPPHPAALLAAVLTVFPPLASNGATFGDFTYVDNGSTITITDFPDTFPGAVTIPSTIDGKPVTSIGDSAFAGCASVTNVVIPSSVTTIGNAAFKDCWGLESAPLPSGVTSIGSEAFSGCFDLMSASIPAGVTIIQDHTFAYCFDLASVTLPSSVTDIGESAFSSCDALKSVTLPANVKSIGDYAFAFSEGLAGVQIPSKVTTIGRKAFWLCEALTNATIASSIISELDGTFFDCSKMKSATFLGHAPSLVTEPFDGTAAGFRVYYYDGKKGFTWPQWQGYPTTPIGAEITVQQPVGSFLVDDQSKKSFGSVKVGKKGAPKTFTIKNIGTKDLTGISITKNGGDANDFVVSKPAKVSLAPGAGTTFKVTFTPTKKGTRNAAIHIKSNDANENPFDIKLAGMGVK